MPTINLLPEETRLTIAQDNDKVLVAGPFSIDGTVISRDGKRLRFLIKLPDEADAAALVDINSVDNAMQVLPLGEPEDGQWAIDLRGLLPAPGFYAFRTDIANQADPDTDRETVGLGFIRVKAT